METISIFLPTILQRKLLRDKLIAESEFQVNSLETDSIIIDVYGDEGQMTIGAKRNLMIERCKTDYFVFIDDDDMIAPGYIQYLLDVADSMADVGGMKGEFFKNGQYVCEFSRSIEYYGFPYKDSEPLK